jgi:hypothetical protein
MSDYSGSEERSGVQKVIKQIAQFKPQEVVVSTKLLTK